MMDPWPSSPPPPPLPLSASSSSSPLPPPLPLPSSYSSPPPLCPELDLSLPLSHCDPHTSRKVHFQEPTDVAGTQETFDPSRRLRNRVSGRRTTQSQRSKAPHNGRADTQEAGAELSNEEPGCEGPLQGPELNTSLAVMAELRALQEAEFDSQKAIQDTLQKSTHTQNIINTKVTQGVNVSHSQLLYTSLVSLAIEENQLISEAARNRLIAPPSSHHDNKELSNQDAGAIKGPSLSQFFTSEFLREKPFLPGGEPTGGLPQPCPDHAHSAFDLYRRHTRWSPTP